MASGKLIVPDKRIITNQNTDWVNTAWLGLGDTSLIDIENPLETKRQIEVDNPGLKEAGLMRNPDYLSFACKTLLSMNGIDPLELLPMQSVIMEELWRRAFPMLIGSRGFGKVLKSDELIRVQDGWTTMEELRVGDIVYDGNGQLCNVIYKTDLQKNVNFYELTLEDNESVDCCEDHNWKVLYNGGWRVLSTKEIIPIQKDCLIPVNNLVYKKYSRIKGIRGIGKRDGYCIQVDSPDSTYITKDYIVTHNTTLLAIYSLLRCILIPGTRIVAVGAAFRQSKLIFEKAEEIYNNSAILRSICDNNSGTKKEPDKYSLIINNSSLTAVPIGTGEKIRGLRASTVINDEFGASSPEIYEVVISGFAAVESSPLQGVKDVSKRQALMDLGLWDKEQENIFKDRPRNQSIISGTATWHFNHFAEYFERYRKIVKSKGDPDKLRRALGSELHKNFDWRDYSVIRIPYEIIPEGFMNDAIVARAKATAGSDAYAREYSCIFTSDSDGFFRRSMIEKCTTSENKPVELSSGPIWFDAMIKGNPSGKYIFGIDPSIGSSDEKAQSDNFSIVILELQEDHTRIVYSWTTNRAEFRKRLSTGQTKHGQFYAFCARKIRDLMNSFPCAHIAMDSQGGGILLYEALNDENNMLPGEPKVWETIDESKEKQTDDYSGLHILELCQFAKYDWLREANYGMHKDFSDKLLLFPRFDAVTLGISAEEDAARLKKLKERNPKDKVYLLDTFEDCVLEIEELKDELSSIVVTVVGTGINVRERWDTPEIQLSTGKKARMRKDRYSALLMANAAARKTQRYVAPPSYNPIGIRVGEKIEGDGGRMYDGPDWYDVGQDCIGFVIRR